MRISKSRIEGIEHSTYGFDRDVLVLTCPKCDFEDYMFSARELGNEQE